MTTLQEQILASINFGEFKSKFAEIGTNQNLKKTVVRQNNFLQTLFFFTLIDVKKAFSHIYFHTFYVIQQILFLSNLKKETNSAICQI